MRNLFWSALSPQRLHRSSSGGRQVRFAAAALVLVPLHGCGSGSAATPEQAGAESSIPGPTLEGPNVIRYPLGPYKFKNPRRYITQGERHSSGSCAYVASGTMPAEAVEVQEIVIAEDPDTCRYLVVGGRRGAAVRQPAHT
jgi:hypothetical protein